MLNKDKILWLTVITFSIIIVFRESCNQSNTSKLIDSIQQYKDSAQHYKILKDVEVSHNQSLVLENKEQIKSLFAKNDTMIKLLDSYKDLKSITIIKEKIIIKDSIPFEVKIPCSFEPFSIYRDSLHYRFKGTISESFFRIDSLVIPNKQSIVIGEKKLGFLKGKEKRVEIINSNPLIRTTNISNHIIEDKKKWYETRAFSFGVGFLFGYGTSQTTKK